MRVWHAAGRRGGLDSQNRRPPATDRQNLTSFSRVTGAVVLLTALILSVLALAESAHGSLPLVVDLRGESLATVLAAQTCAGLMNRDAVGGGGVYTLMHDEDTTWLSLLAPAPPPPADAKALLTACFASGLVRGRVRYAFAAQQGIVPNIVTVAAVLDAVPLEDDSPFVAAADVTVFDALVAWSGFRSLNATADTFARFGAATSGLAKMNPGWNVHDAPLGPWTLKNAPDLSLVDWIVKQRLFNFFLLEGCLPGTAENALMEEIATTNAWPRPLAVWGYDDTFAVAGDLFEAETTCVRERNMGQIATVGVNNLAWLSRAPPVTQPLVGRVARASFNASKTYVALVVGDGDNIAMVKKSRYDWLQQRLAACRSAVATAAAAKCFPLLWTMSPHLVRAAPDLLRAFYNQTLETGADAFVLPPSGHLYSYPGMMEPSDQAAYVEATDADARLLNTSGTVEWEMFWAWSRTIAEYLPQYAARGIVKSFFASNVPYLLPVFEFGADEYFKVIADAVVLFRPNEWRGTSGGADPLEPWTNDAPTVAARINAYPRGTCTHLYLTSDGGGKIADLFDLVALLDEHVEIVGNEIGDLALAEHAHRRSG